MFYTIVGGFIGNLSYKELHNMLGAPLLEATNQNSHNYYAAYKMLEALEEYIETMQR